MGDPLVCGRCYRRYPFVKVIWCRHTTIVGGLYLCVTCHRILHGRVCRSQNNPGGKKCVLSCSLCRLRRAEVACPLCTVKLEDVAITATLCAECNNSAHMDHKAIHLEHVYQLPLE